MSKAEDILVDTDGGGEIIMEEEEPAEESNDPNTSLKVVRTRRGFAQTPLQTGRKSKNRREEIEESFPEDVDNFVAETGCPVYTTQKLNAEDIATLLLTPDGIDPDKVCCRVPPACPGAGCWVFVVSLEHIDPDDISCDQMGKYGRPSGRKHYFALTDEGLKKVVGRGELSHGDYDYAVRANRYQHGDDQQGNLFHKLTFMAYNNQNDLLGPYGVVQYLADVQPSRLQRMPRTNSKSERPLVRTKPSAMKTAKSLLMSRTPREVMDTMAGGVDGEIDPADLPRDVQAISSLSRRTPGARRSKRGRPAAKSGSEEGEYMEDYDNFVASPRSSWKTVSTTPAQRSQIDALQMQVLAMEKKRHQAEIDKFVMEKEKLASEREKYVSEKEKLENESEMLKANTEKLHLEMEVLKAKKYKLDLETGKVREDENVVVHEDIEYRAYQQ